MSNPTIPWQLLQLDPDTDAPRLMQDFEAIQDWLLTEAIHRHHLQFLTFDIPAVTAGTGGDVTGLSFLQAFPTGVTPAIMVQQNSTGAPVGGVSQLTFYPFNITNTGCDVRCQNPGSVNGSAAPGGGRLIAFDASFDVSL